VRSPAPRCWEITHDPATREPLWHDGDLPLAVADTVPGGTLDPGAVLSGLARAVLGAGGRIHEQTRVDVLGVGRERVLRTRGADVVAERVVVATNAYLPTFLELPIDLRPALTLACRDRTTGRSNARRHRPRIADAVLHRRPPLPLGPHHQRQQSRLRCRSALPANHDVRTVHVESEEARTAFARLEARIHGLHPALQDAPIELRWGGPISFIPSRAPVLCAHPNDPNVIVTAGCAGHGVALSFRLGELIALHLTQGRRLPSWGAIEPSIGAPA
jgi:glycine/D-amino acid oxidase-like deaminating enzyme